MSLTGLCTAILIVITVAPVCCVDFKPFFFMISWRKIKLWPGQSLTQINNTVYELPVLFNLFQTVII